MRKSIRKSEIFTISVVRNIACSLHKPIKTLTIFLELTRPYCQFSAIKRAMDSSATASLKNRHSFLVSW